MTDEAPGKADEDVPVWGATGREGAEDYIEFEPSPSKEAAEHAVARDEDANGQQAKSAVEASSEQQDQQNGQADTTVLLPVTEDRDTAAPLPDSCLPAEDSLPEWEAMPDIPETWRPTPLFLVRNIPITDEVKEEHIKKLVETIRSLKVRSINFDDRPSERIMGRRSALVRLQPPPLPWKKERPADEEEILSPEEQDSSRKEANGTEPNPAEQEAPKKRRTPKKSQAPKDGDVVNYAAWAVSRLKAQNPPLQLAGEQVAFETGSLQVQLYIGNLSPEWQEDEAFIKAMESYGKLERAFVMRNAAGLSKGYAFVDFSLPGSALACKQAMDEIERNMRPDPRKQKDMKSAQPDSAGRAPQDGQTQAEATDGAKPTSAHGDKKEGNGAGEEQKEEVQKRAQAFKLAGWPEGSSRLVKLLRAEWAIMRSVDVLFSRVLYVANLRTSQGSQKQLKEIFEQFGKVQEVTVPINKATLTTKGFAFVAFVNGLAADRAYRALEKSGSEEIGGALVSFANSAKHTEMQARMPNSLLGGRPQTGGRGPMPLMPGARNAGMPGRGYALPGPAGFSNMQMGRIPAGRGAFPGRGMGSRGVRSFEAPDRKQLHLQAGMAAQTQMARQMEIRMQQQMQAQQVQLQAQMHAQLRQAQMQVQQFQQQAAQLQRQAAQAQAKAAAEAEARKRVEEEARRAALGAPLPPGGIKRGPTAHYTSSYAAAPEAAGPRGGAAYGSQAGAYSAQAAGPAAAAAAAPQGRLGAAPAGAYSQSGYGTSTGAAAYSPATGYNASQAGYGAQAARGGYSAQAYGSAASGQAGYTDGYGTGANAYGSQGYSASDYDGTSTGYTQAEYGTGTADPAGYGQQVGYDQQESYGPNAYAQQGYGYSAEGSYGASDATSAGHAGYGTSQSDYPAVYAQGAGSSYGAADASGYGQQAAYASYGQQGAAVSQKRPNPYQQAAYGAYGGTGGSYGTQGGDFGKRPRY